MEEFEEMRKKEAAAKEDPSSKRSDSGGRERGDGSLRERQGQKIGEKAWEREDRGDTERI